MTNSKVASTSHTLQDTVHKAQKLASEISARLSSPIELEFESISSKLDALASDFNPYVNIESLPGARTPKWYTVEIEFESGESQSKSRAIEVSTDGAFVMKSVMCVYLNEDTNEDNYSGAGGTSTAVGRHLPTSTYPIFALGNFRNVVVTAPTTPLGNAPVGALYQNKLYTTPEFSVGFELESLGIQLTERPIPASFIYSFSNPLYFSSKCYIDRGERLIVTARPDARVPLKGKFRLIMHGYQVLGDINPKPLRRLR